LAQAASASRRKALASFLQVRTSSQALAARDRATKLLEQRAKTLASKVLAQLVAKVANNPFAKVIQMIKDLLSRLKDESASEADHKAFCDEELHRNKNARDQKESDVARLRAEIEVETAQISDLAGEIAALAEEQAALKKSLEEATEQRSKEKTNNLAVIKDAEAGQDSLKQAIAVLKEFYAQHGGLIQVHAVTMQVPDMAAYSGMQRRQAGVVGMLEVILSDFARLEADSRAAETKEAEMYNKFIADAEQTLESKRKAEFKLRLEKDQAEFDKEQFQKDLDASQDQLDAAKQYYEELKPQCVVVNVTFEERSRRRQEEIEALQEAYRILDSKENQ